MADSNLTLTGDDLARADIGIIHAIKWWKTRGRSKHVRNEIAKLEETRDKLHAIDQHAYPFESGYSEVIEMPDFGSEPIMRLDARVISGTRKKAERYNRERPTYEPLQSPAPKPQRRGK